MQVKYSKNKNTQETTSENPQQPNEIYDMND